MIEDRSTSRKVLQFRSDKAADAERSIVREVPLTLIVNGRELITLLTTGDANRALAVGFLLSEGFLQDPEDLVNLRVDDAAGRVEVELSGNLDLMDKLWGKRAVTSGCGKGSTFTHVLDSLQTKRSVSDLSVRPEQVYALMKDLNERSDLYRRTRGVHNAALAEPGGIVLFRDDIGRHNAVDKLRGECFLEGVDLKNRILVTTGRISSEIVIKVARMELPILISRSAPTSLALDLAGRLEMTLIGYVRGESMTVYTGEKRIENY